jgi:pimeloyl-ACP methyl ester carboxylesterase
MARDSAAEWEEPMADLHTELVVVDGRRTEVVAGGDGEPLVFMHGGGIVEGFDCFRPLADRYRFLAPQMPGFGQTDIAPRIRSIDELVEHNARLFDELGIGSFTLVGHSLGGWVASSFAAAHPERVRTLTVAAPYGLDVPEHPIARTREMAPGELYTTLTNDPSVFEGRLPDGPDEAFEAARAAEGLSLSGLVPGPFDPTLAPKLARLSMPMLIQWGDDDRIVPPGHLPAWRAALPGAAVDVYPGVGHLLYHEHRPAVDALAAMAERAPAASV